MENKSLKGFAMVTILAIVAGVLVLGGLAYYANRPKTESVNMTEEKAMAEKEAMMEKKGEEVMIKKEESVMMDKKGEMMTKGETMMKYSGAMLAGKTAPLLDFNKTDYDMAIKSDKVVVLYFYANWCPICIAEFPIMQEEFNQLTTDKVIGFRVNYNDSQTDGDEKNLAREFGVAYQHTKIFIKNGQRILKSPEGWDKNRYATEINKALAQ